MEEIEKRAQDIAEVLKNKEAYDVIILNVGERTIVADYFVIASGRSGLHVKALSDGVEEALAKQGVFPARKEGYAYGRWVVIDYLSILVHIFHKEEREFYKLERLWSDTLNPVYAQGDGDG